MIFMQTTIAAGRHRDRIFRLLPSNHRIRALDHPYTLKTNWVLNIGMFCAVHEFFRLVLNEFLTICSSFVKEARKKDIWAVEFDNYVKSGGSNRFAAVSGVRISIYECTATGAINLITSFEDNDVSDLILFMTQNYVKRAFRHWCFIKTAEWGFLHMLLVNYWNTGTVCAVDSWQTWRHPNLWTGFACKEGRKMGSLDRPHQWSQSIENLPVQAIFACIGIERSFR